ncbi:MAG: DnaD domain protein [Chloroflexi bacterium]|nr:DnaD domain protein [Chloroflexota bacterium]
MKLFSGFASGKISVTPVPNQFFSELLPAIDDLAELKLTLHFLWQIANAHAREQFIRADELAADQTLMQSFTAPDSLTRALERAVARGTLLQSNDAYFLNNAAGRKAFERAQSAGEKSAPAPSHTRAPAPARPNIFSLYEQNIGMLTPMLAEELKDAEKEYRAEWIADAFKIAVENNKRSWAYVRKILQRWQTEGRGDASKKGKPWYDEYRKFVNR